MELERREPTEEVLDFIDYFNGYITIDSRNKRRFEKAISLDKAIKIFESNLIDIRKVYELSKLYKNSEEIRKTFSKLSKFRDEDEVVGVQLDKVEAIAEYLGKHESKGLVKKAKDLVENEDRIDNIPYAKHFVESYIHSDKIFTSDFLKEEKIDKSTFDYFKGIVSEFDEKLFDEYKTKEIDNSKDRRYTARRLIRDLYEGATTGKVRFGEEFDALKCYELMPYKNEEQLNELLEDFKEKKASTVEQKTRKLLKVVEPEKADTVYNYLIKNGIITKGSYTFRSPFTTVEKVREESGVSVNGQEVTDEHKEAIIKYLQVREVAMFEKAVVLVRNKVLANEIFLDEEKHLCIRKNNK